MAHELGDVELFCLETSLDHPDKVSRQLLCSETGVEQRWKAADVLVGSLVGERFSAALPFEASWEQKAIGENNRGGQ